MRLRHLPIVLLACLISVPSRAELSGDDYLGRSAIHDATERARVQALIDTERQREAERAETLARERAQEKARRAAEHAAESARRPQGEVLTEIHCGSCHALEMLQAARHTGLGWSLTIARMRWLNGARIPDDDAARIREHLARTQPAKRGRALVEYGLAALFVLLPIAWALRRWSRSSSVEQTPGRPRG
jgi:hypothetical protein